MRNKYTCCGKEVLAFLALRLFRMSCKSCVKLKAPVVQKMAKSHIIPAQYRAFKSRLKTWKNSYQRKTWRYRLFIEWLYFDLDLFFSCMHIAKIRHSYSLPSLTIFILDKKYSIYCFQCLFCKSGLLKFVGGSKALARGIRGLTTIACSIVYYTNSDLIYLINRLFFSKHSHLLYNLKS